MTKIINFFRKSAGACFPSRSSLVLRGSGTEGTIKTAGGKLAERQLAQEEAYFYKENKDRLEKLKKKSSESKKSKENSEKEDKVDKP
jgi:hypothetical protein